MREDDFEVYLRTRICRKIPSHPTNLLSQYFAQFDTVTQKKLRDHKMWLIETL